jgi:hypothetical protein
MAFLVGGANTLTAGYDIDNSLRLTDGDSAVLTDTLGTPTDIDKFTISLWYKRGILYSQAQTGQALISCHRGATSNPFGVVSHSGGDEVEFFAFDDENTTVMNLTTDREFRDVSAWYHIVLAVDTTQGTAANRAKFYINGVQETSFSGETYPDQNKDLAWNQSGTVHYIGKYQYTGATFFDGYISEFYFIDGQQLTPSDFGETNDNGIWIPKDAKDDLTFGDNGYYLEFKNSAVGSGASDTIGADTSGNDRHFTSTNVAVTDQCTDSPTNNFATFNPLMYYSGVGGGTPTVFAFSEGNTKVTGSSSGTGFTPAIGSIGVSSGKWYYEFYTSTDDSGTKIGGAMNYDHDAAKSTAAHYGVRASNGTFYYNDSTNGSLSNATEWKDDGDILSVALNMDDNEISFSTNGASYTAAQSITGNAIASGTLHPAIFLADDEIVTVNFGNPNWALSSGVADANGYGNFEYAVPSGYFALCTKNLAEFG